MPLHSAQKLYLLQQQPAIVAVYTEIVDGIEQLVVLRKAGTNPDKLALPPRLYDMPVVVRTSPEFRDLRLMRDDLRRETPCPRADDHRRCYDEPVPGGVQLQPYQAPWVGTLGTCCRFHGRDKTTKFGILSNWHVMVPHNPRDRHPQHQPSDQFQAVAYLDDFMDVSPSAPNYFDAAVADAKIGNYHAVSRLLLGLGDLGRNAQTVQVGDHVNKSGRTTGITSGLVDSLDAAVRVSYGDFEATFVDQILVAHDTEAFSAAGDSGSLVVAGLSNNPVGLLFAGGGGTTVVSPIAPIAQRFGITFDF